MKLVVKHYGRIKAGKLIFDIPDLYRQQVLELEGQNVVMEIKKRHEKPTLSQYAYYRGGILIACYQSEMFSHCDKKDDIHDDYFAPKFLSYKKIVEFKGEKKEITKERSLADLSKDEMKDFITKVLIDCDMNEIQVMPPETFYNKYYQK